MNARYFATSALVAAIAVAACSQPASDDAGTTAAAETDGAQTADTQTADASAEAWTAPRTPWGDPDLRGKWPLDSQGRTPMQRPEALGDKAFLTDEEYAEALDAARAAAGGYEEEEDANKLGNGHWFEWGQPLRQTSLIVEPANGRIPPMTPEGAERAAHMKSSWSEAVFEDLSDFNSLDQCITRGLPASMIHFPYNNGVEVYQSPGYVAIRLELIHETRIIPIDDRPPLPDSMSTWLGSSRGHWEGDTLVIETSNFNGVAPMVIVGPSNEPVPTSTAMHITERLTPTGPNTIQYEATIEDPVDLTAPFKMSFPWARNSDYVIYEYACHEANTVVPNYIHATSPRFAGGDEGEGFSTEEWLRTSGVTTADQAAEEAAERNVQND